MAASDWVKDDSVTKQKSSGGEWERDDAIEKPKPGFFQEFGEKLGQDIQDTGAGIYSTLQGIGTDELGTIKAIGKGILSQQGHEFDVAKDRFKEGRYSEAFGHGLASALPIVGPMAAEIGENLPEHPGRAAAQVLELAGPEAVKFLPKRVPLRGPILKNVHNPVEEAALQSVEKDVRMTPGQRTGNHALTRIEGMMPNLPGSSTRATEFFEGQQADLAKKVNKIASSASPKSANAYGAGQAVQERLTDRIIKLKNQAGKFYDDVRAQTATNQVTVQTGTKPILGAGNKPLLGPTGQPITAPVTQVFETPVDVASMRVGPLKAIYNDLIENMPEVRRLNSPAFRALQQVMDSEMTHMSAMDFDKFLGAVKALVRDGKSSYLTSTSQRLAKQIIGQGESALNNALKTVKPAASAAKGAPSIAEKLKSARNMVKSYYEAGELRAEFSGEPATIYSRLVAKGDRMLDHLKDLQRMAPNELKMVGRTFLEGMVDKATREGGFGRAAGIMEDWRTMGPETKKLLYGPQLTNDIDNFLLAAKRLTKPINASNSGHVMAAMGGLGIAGQAVVLTLLGHAHEAATIATVTYGVPAIASRVLFSPGGAKLLTKAITLPARTPAAIAAYGALANRVFSAETQWQGEQKQQQSTSQPAVQ